MNHNRKNAQYYINEEKRTITCVLQNCQNDLYEVINSIDCDCNMRFDCCFDMNYHELKMKKVYVGVAKCAPDDTWDVEYGKLLAFHRAKHNHDTDFFRKAQHFIQSFDDLLVEYCTGINRIGDKFRKNADRRRDELDLE